MSDATLFLTLGPINPGCGRNNTIHWMLMEHMQPSGEPCPSHPRYCHLYGAVTRYSKGHFTILSNQLLQDDGKCGKTANPINVGLLLHSFCCGVSLLIKSSAVWNTMMVYKAFSFFMNDSLGKSIAYRNANLYVECLVQ